MTSLQKIIQQIKFKSKFDLEQSFDYQKNVEEKIKISSKEDLILMTSGFSLSFPLAFLICFLAKDMQFSFLVTCFCALSTLAIPLISIHLYRYCYKDIFSLFNKNKKLEASYQKDFETQLFMAANNQEKLIALFQAFEAEPDIKNRFNLAELFQSVSKELKNKEKIAQLLAPVFEYFLKRQYAKQGIDLGSDNKAKENYQALVSQAQKKLEASELLFSTHPPLKANSLNART